MKKKEKEGTKKDTVAPSQSSRPPITNSPNPAIFSQRIIVPNPHQLTGQTTAELRDKTRHPIERLSHKKKDITSKRRL
jgi:hypothetical protein